MEGWDEVEAWSTTQWRRYRAALFPELWNGFEFEFLRLLVIDLIWETLAREVGAFGPEIAQEWSERRALRFGAIRERSECLANPRLDVEVGEGGRLFRGEGRFGLQYQEPGLKCQVRDRVLDITLILEADGVASLEFAKWPQTEGSSRRKGNAEVRKVKCFMKDERRIYTGTWTSNADDTVDAVIDFFLAGEVPWTVRITVDAINPAAADAEFRVPVFGDCPGKKWKARKTGRNTLKPGQLPPAAPSFRCYLFDFTLIEQAG